jgi:hypothetical protein
MDHPEGSIVDDSPAVKPNRRRSGFIGLGVVGAVIAIAIIGGTTAANRPHASVNKSRVGTSAQAEGPAANSITDDQLQLIFQHCPEVFANDTDASYQIMHLDQLTAKIIYNTARLSTPNTVDASTEYILELLHTAYPNG